MWLWLMPITENRMRGRGLCFTDIPNPSFGSTEIAAAELARRCMNFRRETRSNFMVIPYTAAATLELHAPTAHVKESKDRRSEGEHRQVGAIRQCNKDTCSPGG